MNAILDKDRQTLREIVRGERPLGDLQLLGIQCQREGSSCHVDDPRNITVSVDVHDLVQGLLHYLPQREALRDWALFVNAADSLDLDVENHPSGELVLDALWDAAFGNPLDAKVVEALQDLAPGRQEG